ncbi:phosphoglycerate mutase family protein [Sneathiella marina]|uniref:Phosphoglycerate mutase family protein n=1 Tax=Sneathiella marina TaxID=2950108 RepID=A0ABY4W0J3_9PROT|nr:histidine phosphatase family protein [Sneathiella marina]USG60374.1 phosphoglycerate mutase family protein [Sneathiella marina]
MGVKIYLVRHGEAGGAWDSTADPGLSVKGISQADTVARQLNEAIAPVRIFSSPLQRAQETAKPIGELWHQSVDIAPQLTEVPSAGIEFKDRRQWLTGVLQGQWSDQSNVLKNWRSNIVEFAKSQTEDAIFVTHFVVINSLVGFTESNDNVLVFRPDTCSVTTIGLNVDRLHLIEKGQEALTVIK